MGNLINCSAIIVGSLIGLFLKKGFNENIKNGLYTVMGLGICIVGFNGLISIMLYVENNSIKLRF